jgi:uncharacterized protein
MEWANIIAGLIVGVLVGLTGVGGGSLMAPLMIYAFGFSPTTAVGTDLFFAGITKIVGGLVHHHQGGVDKTVLKRLMLGSVPATLIMLYCITHIGMHQMKDGLIIYALGGVLVLTAFATLVRHRFVAWSHAYQRAHARDIPVNLQYGLTVLAGAVLGSIVTLTSVGAGALGVTLILAIYPLRMKAAKLVATDIVHAIPITLLGGFGYLFYGQSEHPIAYHYMFGNVDITMLLWLLLGSIPGIMLGSRLTKYVPERAMQNLLAFVLLAVGLKMLWK